MQYELIVLIGFRIDFFLETLLYDKGSDADLTQRKDFDD